MNSADLLGLVISILIGSLTAYLAKGRGRSPAIWFFIGMLFGIFGLIALFFFPIVNAMALQTPSGEPVTIVTKPQAVDDAFSRKSWFYLDAERKQEGPVALNALLDLWKQGAISSPTYVWCEGMEQWKKIQELPDLALRLSQ